MYGLECKHLFCKGCVSDYLEFNISNGKVVKIKCADLNCQLNFNRDQIRLFGSKELFEKYLRFKENIDVNMNQKLKWCPKADCNNFVK
jgi:hypothetical protein